MVFPGWQFQRAFFANVRLDNLLIGLRAFPVLSMLVGLAATGMLATAAWLLWRCARPRTMSEAGLGVRLAALLVLATLSILMPSAWQRLGQFMGQYRSNHALSKTAGGELLADPDPVPRNVVRAAAGKNLVIVYLESLERIYTDDRIFPGLTPNLNRWRALGLDYSNYLTFTGADYTIAGLFAS